MPTFYRTLFTPEHLDNWKRGYYYSTHAIVPGEWVEVYFDKQSTNIEDYPLVFEKNVFTLKGLKAFLEFVPKYKRTEQWTNEDLVLVGELDGVCAFDNPQDAYNYGHESITGKIGKELYVDFIGEIVCPAPENNGFVVSVLSDFSIYNTIDFVKKYNLKS